MKNPTIHNVNKLAQILILVSAIQNKGIGHVFVNLYGHVSMIDVGVHDGEWTKDSVKFTICDCSTNDTKSLAAAVSTLTQILENGLSVLPGYLKVKEKEKARDEAELKRLLSKTGVTADFKNVA